MYNLVLDITPIILQLFITLREEDKNREDYIEQITLIIHSAAERILYAQTHESTEHWRKLSNNNYKLLYHDLVSFSLNSGTMINDDWTIDVFIKSTIAEFTFHKRF